MPFSDVYKPKCYCTRVRYKSMGPSPWNYVCEEHRSEWDTRFLKVFPHGMRDTTDFKLTYNIRFESFGAYEDWGQGWIAEGTLPDGRTVRKSHRYMQQAVESWLKAAEKPKEENAANNN